MSCREFEGAGVGQFSFEMGLESGDESKNCS